MSDAGSEHAQILHIDPIERHADQQSPIRPCGSRQCREESGFSQQTIQRSPILARERVEVADNEPIRRRPSKRALQDGFDLSNLQFDGREGLDMHIVEANFRRTDGKRRPQCHARQVIASALLRNDEALDVSEGIPAEEREPDLPITLPLAGEIDVVESEAFGENARVTRVAIAHDFLKREHIGARQFRMRTKEC